MYGLNVAGLLVNTFGILGVLMLHERGVHWLPLISLAAFAMTGKKEGVRWALGGLFGVFTVLLMDRFSATPVHPILTISNIVLSYSIVTLIAWFFMRHIEMHQQGILDAALEKERLDVAQNLAGGIAHLVNNEMQVIVNTVHLLKNEAQSEKVASRLERIINTSNKASNHANQLLSYASGGQIYLDKTIHVVDVLTRVLEPWKQTLPKSIHIEVQKADFTAQCIGDPVQIGQVLVGLLDNAKEAIEERYADAESMDQEETGLISVVFKEKMITEDSPSHETPSGKYIMISVEDNGCGIDSSIRHKIFEPFYSSKFTGRGMGLAAAHGIIKKHGGHISVESEKGKGSVFHIWLPEAVKVVT